MNQKETPYNQAVMPGFLPQFQLNMSQVAELYKRSESAPLDAATPNVTGGTQINAPTTVEGSTIHTELSGSATEEDRQKLMTTVTAELDKRDQRMP
ncbi:hypothetical protein [Pseudomonas sp. R5(2019)]|uniref:hypothetical protein n=1 Tax=Pseudomonas sp. R5(2019) TaxID=2697566 RepID=UPI001412AB0F|nr:hypothetical protein [Pseudomonas sp. R5(2019)]NBA96836.1 hypothetical protein [Pseudomonas sp. R5(2019)]